MIRTLEFYTRSKQYTSWVDDIAYIPYPIGYLYNIYPSKRMIKELNIVIPNDL